MIAYIGDGPIRSRHAHTRRERFRGTEGFDRRIHTIASSEFEDGINGVFLCEVDNHITTILLRQRYAIRNISDRLDEGWFALELIRKVS